MNNYIIISLSSLLFVIYSYNCLKIIPERAAIIYTNETYVTNVSINVRRNRRRGEYVVNLEIYLKLWVGNNVSIDIVLYEYLHNEYKRSFVELHFKCCDLILRDPYVGFVVRQAGITKCPISPGKIELKNLTFDMVLPSVWPFEKGKGVLTAVDNTNGVVIGEGELMMTFKQKVGK